MRYDDSDIPAPPPGKLGRYELLEPLGKGGMAEVWRAQATGARDFRREVLVKRIRPEFAARKAFIDLFIQEARLVSQLQHPNIASVLDFGSVDGQYYMVMEYVRGWDLLKILTHAARIRAPLAFEHAMVICSAVARALSHAHCGLEGDGTPVPVIHFDVSPSNILIGAPGVVKLTDFGVARAGYEEGDDQPPDHLRGKYAYMSPEQVAGRRVDCRTDIFSAGVVMYESITLKRLFRGRTVPETLENVRRADIEPRLRLHPEIPEAIRDILRRALARSPADRYASARELANDIDQALFNQRIRVTPEETWIAVEALCKRSIQQTGPIDVMLGRPTWGPEVQETTIPPETESQIDATPLELDTGQVRTLAVNSAAALMKLFASGSFEPDDMVRIADEPWQRARDVPFLKPLWEGPDREELATADRYGAMDLSRALSLLIGLGVSRATGRLRLHRRGARKDVFLRRGKIVHIATTLKGELLGPYLLRSKLVSVEALTTAIGSPDYSDLPLGELLVQRGHLDRITLARAISDQLSEKIAEVMTWRRGTFHWFEDQRPAPNIVPQAVSLLPALTRGVREHVGCSDREAYLYAFGNPRFEVADEASFPLEEVGLHARELRVLDALRGRGGALRDLWSRCVRRPGDSEALLLVLYMLHHTGHVLVNRPRPQ